MAKQLEEAWAAAIDQEGTYADASCVLEIDVLPPTGEGEAVDAGLWPMTTFDVVRSVLMSLRDVRAEVLPERWEVLLMDGDHAGYALVVEGLERIRTLCETDNPWLVAHKWVMTRVEDSVRFPQTYVVGLKGSVVNVVDVATKAAGSWWAAADKLTRLKKEFKYVHMETGIVYHLIMEQGANGQGQGSEAGFRLKARWSHSASRRDKARRGASAKGPEAGAAVAADAALKADVNNVLRHGLRLASIARNEPVPMKVNASADVLAGYNKLISTARRGAGRGQARGAGTGDGRPFFVAPKPVTLEQVHLIDPETRFGAVSIQSDYCVTDKADGERMLFYVHSDGTCYLINNALDVRNTGIVAKSSRLHNSLADGEYIDATSMRFPGQKSLFAAFDVYFFNGHSLINRPLMESVASVRGGAGAGAGRNDGRNDGRNNNRPQAAEQGPSGARNTIMREMFEDIGMWNLSQSPMSLTMKAHRHAPGAAIFKAAAEVLASSERLPYANDGLIFTPANLFVWGVYANGRPVSIAPELGRWDRVFKWKPADQNSIDFLVRDTERVKMVGAQRFKGFQLLCGLNMGKTKPITVPEGMRYLHDPEARGEVLALRERYEPAPFDPVSYYQEGVDVAWIPIDGDGQCRTTDGEVMTDESIVEFRYIVEGEGAEGAEADASGAGWRPMRLREDKTRLYRTSHNISRAANDMGTARNIWITIFEPVTREMVSGAADAMNAAEGAKESSVENRYYARDIARYHLLSVNMQNFHNLVVKRFMFEYPDVSYRRTLLELACGQAGDLPRWTDAGYAMVVGIDKNQNNIEDPANGAYARGLRVLTERRGRHHTGEPPGMAFLIGDCGELLSTGAAFRDAAAEESGKLWSALSGGKTSAEYVRAIAAGFREAGGGSGSRGLHFDVVSCEFAVHYFFKSAETLDAFLTNVSSHLRQGGYFLTTFMDGDSVHDALDKEVVSGRGGVVKGVVANTVIWAVQRLWTGVYDPATEDVYGKEIGVYLENTRQTITEYLVPFDVLKQKAAAHGLKLDRSETFGRTFERESAAHSTWEDPMHHIFDKFRREPVQRRFSSFNRWAVFRKA